MIKFRSFVEGANPPRSVAFRYVFFMGRPRPESHHNH